MSVFRSGDLFVAQIFFDETAVAAGDMLTTFLCSGRCASFGEVEPRKLA